MRKTILDSKYKRGFFWDKKGKARNLSAKNKQVKPVFTERELGNITAQRELVKKGNAKLRTLKRNNLEVPENIKTLLNDSGNFYNMKISPDMSIRDKEIINNAQQITKFINDYSTKKIKKLYKEANVDVKRELQSDNIKRLVRNANARIRNLEKQGYNIPSYYSSALNENNRFSLKPLNKNQVLLDKYEEIINNFLNSEWGSVSAQKKLTKEINEKITNRVKTLEEKSETLFEKGDVVGSAEIDKKVARIKEAMKEDKDFGKSLQKKIGLVWGELRDSLEVVYLSSDTINNTIQANIEKDIFDIADIIETMGAVEEAKEEQNIAEKEAKAKKEGRKRKNRGKRRN